MSASIGSRNASVLPVPVGAIPIIARVSGIGCRCGRIVAWMGFGFRIEWVVRWWRRMGGSVAGNAVSAERGEGGDIGGSVWVARVGEWGRGARVEEGRGLKRRRGEKLVER